VDIFKPGTYTGNETCNMHIFLLWIELRVGTVHIWPNRLSFLIKTNFSRYGKNNSFNVHVCKFMEYSYISTTVYHTIWKWYKRWRMREKKKENESDEAKSDRNDTWYCWHIMIYDLVVMESNTSEMKIICRRVLAGENDK